LNRRLVGPGLDVLEEEEEEEEMMMMMIIIIIIILVKLLQCLSLPTD
jgi:hypothetical protein